MPPENGTPQPPRNGTLDSKNDPNSTELDPCLGHPDPNDKSNKQRGFFENRISAVQARTGLSRTGVFVGLGLVIGVVLLALIVIGMGIGWPGVPHKFLYPVCEDSGCLRAAAQIQENLDTSMSPCTNLWGAVCAGWTKKGSRPLDRPVWNVKEQLIQKESEEIRDLISTLELPLHMGTVEWKLKHFYEACLDVDTLNIDEARPLTNIISELGGWYILRDWNDEDFDGVAVLKKLQVKYGVSPFFRIHVEPDPHVPNTHSVRVSPSGLGLPDKEYYFRDEDEQIQTAYRDYIRDVIISLSSTKNDATKFGKDIFSYEKRIAEVTPDLVDLQNPITTYNAVSLSELKDTNLIPFYDILQAMYPEASITENMEVIVTSLEYLSQISQIIASTDRRTMNGYLIWTLVTQYLPYLSEQYTSAMDTFNSELFGVSKHQKRWEICCGLVKHHMGVASEFLLQKSHPLSENTRKIANATFRTILNVVKNRIRKFDNTALLYQQLEAKLNSVSLQIGLPESTTSAAFTKDHFVSLKIIKSNLFESVKNAIFFGKKVEQKMLLNTLPEGVFLRRFLGEKPEVRYLEPKNAVFVPRALISEPFFEENFPSSIIYGRLGEEMAHAIISSILPYGSLWTSDKKILSPFHMTVNESVRSVQGTVNCLSRYILDSSPNFLTPSRANETALTVLKHVTAVKIANEALLTTLEQKSHMHQPGLENYEDSALFFLAYSQIQCSDSTKQYQLYENIVNFNLPQKSTLLLSWVQLPEFPEAFGCSPDKKLLCPDIF